MIDNAIKEKAKEKIVEILIITFATVLWIIPIDDVTVELMNNIGAQCTLIIHSGPHDTTQINCINHNKNHPQNQQDHRTIHGPHLHAIHQGS